jgi:iron complex transport system ATP-binding protein
VRIARALSQLTPSHPLDNRDTRSSRFLLLDEPCAGLDLAQARSLHALLRRQACHGVGVVVVEHDLALAALSDRVAVLSRGQLVALGPPRETLTRETLRAVFGLDGALITTPSGGYALDLMSPNAKEPR